MSASLRAVVILLLLIVTSQHSLGGELSDEAYLLRLGAALRRATGYSTAAALQATAAHSAGFSINPAADDVLQADIPAAGMNSTVSHLHTYSQSGAWFTDTAVTANITLPGIGTIPLAYARTDTIDTTTNLGLDNSIRSNEFFWGFSKRVSDSLALGLQARFLTAEIQYEEISPLTIAPTQVETNVLWHIDCNLGARLEVNDMLAIGVLGGLGRESTVSAVRTLVPLPNPVPPPAIISAGSVLGTVEDSPTSGLVRAGIGLTPSERLGIYVDGEYFRLASDRQGAIDIGRALLGMEYAMCPHQMIFVGGSLDKAAEFTFSVGAISTPTTNISYSASYQYNAYPEVDPEFGRFDQVTVSVGGRF